jgi:hypothetical protein
MDMRPLITTDSDHVPPMWLADSLPSKWREQFPRLEDRSDGRYVTFPNTSENQMMIMSGGRGPSVKVADDRELVRVNHSNVCDEAEPGFDPISRFADMDREGVIGAVLIDNAVVSTSHLEPAAEQAWCTIVNDWMADTYQDHLDRFAPGIHLPPARHRRGGARARALRGDGHAPGGAAGRDRHLAIQPAGMGAALGGLRWAADPAHDAHRRYPLRL